MELTDHRTPPTTCPWCQAVHDGALNIGGTEAPEPGDVAVCGSCTMVSVYTEDGRRAPTAAELDELPLIPALAAAVEATRQLILRGKGAGSL